MELKLLEMDHDTDDFRLDYAVISQWWRQRRLDPVPIEVLPPLGAVMFDKTGGYRAAAWMYFDRPFTLKDGRETHPAVCFLHHFVSNPKNTAAETRKFGHALMEFLFTEAREMGYSQVITTTDSGVLASEAESAGFTLNPHPMIQLARAF